jgi:2-oxoglutarate ferredoxin oxidoreductase subunit gamma
MALKPAAWSLTAQSASGKANSTVTISDEKIGSPVIVNPTSAIIMNQISLEAFENKVAKKG